MRRYSIVDKHGHLKVNGSKVVDKLGTSFVLKGVSLFWSQWMPQYYCGSTVSWLSKDWNCNVIRAAIAVNNGGYKDNPKTEWEKIISVIDSSIEEGIYVIVDWHAHEIELEGALEFFHRISNYYGNIPNIIYETWNEPYPRYDWVADIIPYHCKVISTIRANAPESLIVVGTPFFSQYPNVALLDPVPFPNIVYALHFYAASHRLARRNRCLPTLNRIPILVTEYGTCESSGDGIFDPFETREWWNLLEEFGIGHLNWSIADKIETASALTPGASSGGNWKTGDLTDSGRLVRQYLRSTK